jgi:hypothetical protein
MTEQVLICDRCECPRAPFRYIDRRPISSGGQCICADNPPAIPASTEVAYLFARDPDMRTAHVRLHADGSATHLRYVRISGPVVRAETYAWTEVTPLYGPNRGKPYRVVVDSLRAFYREH